MSDIEQDSHNGKNSLVSKTVREGVTFSSELIEIAARSGHNEREFKTTIYGDIEDLLSEGPRASLSTTRALWLWLLLQTILLAAALVILWPDPKGLKFGLHIDTQLLIAVVISGTLGAALPPLWTSPRAQPTRGSI